VRPCEKGRFERLIGEFVSPMRLWRPAWSAADFAEISLSTAALSSSNRSAPALHRFQIR
jgi:hypothetical protein